jgi:putative Holliday junction resolvase
MRTLAIDLGERRVGLAMSDEGGQFATPLEVLFVSSSEAAVGPFISIIQAEGVQRIVLGLPLNMDGTIGPAAERMFKWGQALSQQSGLPVIFVDERLSSFDAEQTLVARKRAGEKLTRQRKKERLDAVAAAGFLQAFLDGKLASLTLPDKLE